MRIFNHVLVRKALTSVARTNGTSNGDSVDRNVSGNTFDSVIFAVLTATLTDGVHTITVQECNDNATWVDAAAGDQTAAVVTSSANDDASFELGYHGNNRYCRLKVVTSGATTGGVLGAVAVLGQSRLQPVR